MPDLEDFEEWFSMEDALALVKGVYQGKYLPEGAVDKKSVNEYAKKYTEAIEKGWKNAGGKISVDFESPDTKMLNALKDNVFHFSAAKNREEILQLSALLRDGNGRLRKWSDFAQEAAKVTTDFKMRYMKVEYDMAVNSSYLAARWTEYKDDDLLTYQTAGDSRVRDSHKSMDGICLPKNHDFWKTFYPPNGWNCRCTVVVSHNRKATPSDKINGDIDSVPSLFRSNLAENGLAFPKNHPYWEGSRALIKYQKSTKPYELDKTPNGNRIFESEATHKDTNSVHERKRQKLEYTQNKISARLMADYYKSDVLLMPEFEEPRKDIWYDWEYLSRGYKHKPKMADSYLVNTKEFYEVKSYEGTYSYRKLKRMVSNASEQANINVFFINQDMPLAKIKEDFKSYLTSLQKNKKEYSTKDVFVVINGQLFKIH